MNNVHRTLDPCNKINARLSCAHLILLVHSLPRKRATARVVVCLVAREDGVGWEHDESLGLGGLRRLEVVPGDDERRACACV